MRKALRIVLWIVAGLLFIVLVALIAINTRAGKNFVRSQAVAFLHKKLGTDVKIGGLDYDLPKKIVLKDVFFGDKAGDTLFAARKLKVDIALLKLLSSTVDIQEVDLEGATVHLYRKRDDSVFNFQYIVDVFSPADTTGPKDTTALDINLDRLNLKDVHVVMNDFAGGSQMAYDIGDLQLTMDKMAPDKLIFAVNKLFVNNVRATLIQGKSYLPPIPQPDTATAPIALQLSANELNLNHVYYNQQNLENKFFMEMQVGKLLAHPGNIDLPAQKVDVKDLLLSHANVNILMKERSAELASKVADTLIDEDAPEEMKWRVTAGQLNLDQVNFVLNNENEPRLARGIDYAHLDVQNLNLDAEQILYTMDTIGGTINHLAVKEKSGLNVHELKTRFEYNPQGGFLRDLFLQTDNSILRDYLNIRYPSLDALAKTPGLMQTDIHLENSVIGIRDILIFAPQLYQQDFFRKHQNGRLALTTTIQGRLAALNIEQFQLSGLGNTEVRLNGKVFGVPDANRLSYNLNIQKLQSSASDLNALLPPSGSQQFRLPDRFGLTGTIAGNTEVFHPNLLLISTDGNAAVKGAIDISRKGQERYNLAVRTQRLNVGRLIRNKEIGIVTADINARGTGFDVRTMQANANGRIQAAGYRGYVYHDIHFEGRAGGEKINFTLNSDDPNARLHVNGKASLAGKYPSINANANIDSIDLHRLNFYSSEMRIHGNIRIVAPVLNPDYPQATITIDDPIITTGGKRYRLDTLFVVAHPSADSGNNIFLQAPSMKLHVWGHTPLTKLGDIVQSKINKHYSLSDTLPVKKTQQPAALPSAYDLHLMARVTNNPLVKVFLPGVKDLDTVAVDGLISQDQLHLTASAPRITFESYKIEKAAVQVNGSDSALTYDASVRHFSQKSLDVWFAKVDGQLSRNDLTSHVSIADRDSVERFKLNGLLSQKGGTQEFHLLPDLKLNYEPWNVNQPNKVVFGKDGFYVENFAISNGRGKIAVNSQTPHLNAPLKAEISDFLLANITQIISKDTLLANGVLAGTIDIKSFKPSPQITSSLGITDLSVLGDTVGNIDIDVHSASSEAVNADLAVTGRGNDITLKGQYFFKPVNGDNLDFRLALNPLNLSAFEGLAQHQIKNSSGYIRGNLQITGSTSEPSLNGELRTDNLQTTVAMLNSRFRMANEPILFKGHNIVLNDFDIQDSAGNTATLNGNLNYKQMTLGMNLNADHWLAMNSTAKDNKTFYGRFLFSSNMHIKGPVAAPDVDGRLSILDGTSVTVTIPQSQPGMQDREGVVQFVDVSDSNSAYILPPMLSDTAEKTLAKVPVGSSVNLNVAVDDDAEFSVIIDEGSGDFVKIRGEGNLNTTVAPDGTLGLVGTYTILDGSYHLNYNFIKRLFRIQNGSTITFSGDPTLAELNVTAIYETDVAPYDLVSRQIQDPGELVYYKQKLPFQVKMNLTGPMMKPVIDFDIQLPEDQNYRVAGTVTDVVQARLSQLRNTPSDLNKQVFALIILNRFVSEDPFQNGAGGGGVEAIARQSASRFISEQLNKFASGLVKGLDLSVGLNSTEDYTTGQKRNRTDLTLGASKRLLNDRLTINVGNDFQLEGPVNNNKNTSYIPGNISVDYDLTADRRYRVRFFRRDEETGIGEANVITTGASFILQKDYNRFRQVFMSKKKKLREEKQKQNEGEAADTQSKSTPQNRQENSSASNKQVMILKDEETAIR